MYKPQTSFANRQVSELQSILQLGEGIVEGAAPEVGDDSTSSPADADSSPSPDLSALVGLLGSGSDSASSGPDDSSPSEGSDSSPSPDLSALAGLLGGAAGGDASAPPDVAGK